MSSSAKSSRTSSVARATTGVSATKVEEEVVTSHQVEMVFSTETKTTETSVVQTINSAAAAVKADVTAIAGGTTGGVVSEVDDNQVDDDNELKKEEVIVRGGRGVPTAEEGEDKEVAEGENDPNSAVGTNEAEADNDDNDGVSVDQNNSIAGDDDDAAPVPTFNMSMQTMTEPEDAPLVGSSDVSLALALSFLQSAEQRIASEQEADSRQLSNNTAWHAATKRLTQWLSEHFHKRAGTLEELMVQTGSEVAEGVEEGVASPFATVLRGSFSDEFQNLATHMWTSVSASLEELASLREERQQLIQGGVVLRQQLSKKEVEYKVGVSAGEERAKELQDLCAAKDEMMAALNAEIIHQKDTIQKMSQTLESSNDRLKEKDALIAEFTSAVSTKSSETAAAAAACCVVSEEVVAEEVDIATNTNTDSINNATTTPAAIEASVAHLTEKLERTELALKSALAELSQKGSEIASLSWSLNMVAETHKSELNEVLEASKKAAAIAAAADDEEARGSGFLGGKVDTSSLGPVLPTFTEASQFYLQGREEINTLRAQVGKLKVRADKVDGLESQVQVAEGRVQQLVACMIGLEEEIQQQRGSEKRLRAEQVALRAEKAALVSQVVQLCLNAGYNHNSSQMERTATSLSHEEGGDASGLQSFAATMTTSSPPSAEDIDRVVNESLSVIHAATAKAAAAAASSSSLVDSSSHQELVEAHRKLKSDVNKLGKDRDYLEKLVVSRRQRLQALTSQTVSASLLQHADTTSPNGNNNNKHRSIQSASVHQAAAALSQLASELATETRGTLTTVLVPSRAAVEGAEGTDDNNNDNYNVVVSSLNNTVADTTTAASAVTALSTSSPSIATFEMISNAIIDNVTLKDTVRNLEVEIGVLSATIRNMKEQQSMPIATAIDGVIQQQQDSSPSVTSNAVENVVTVVNSLMSRCGLLGAQGKDLQNTVATVSKALLHTKKDSTQVESSLAVLQGTLPAVANSVASALAQCGNMQQRLVASKEKVVSLKASLVELQATQMAEQEEIRRQVELIGSKRPREEDEGAESSSNVVVGATLLVSEAKSVATNITTLAGTLHGLKQLTACRKLIEIVASLEKELDEQQVAHASEIAKLGSEFIKGASGGGGAMAASIMAATPDGPRDQQRSAAMVKTFLTTALTV